MKGVLPPAPILTRATGNQAQNLKLKQNQITINSREIARRLGSPSFLRTPTPVLLCSLGSKWTEKYPLLAKWLWERACAEVTEPLSICQECSAMSKKMLENTFHLDN